MNRSITLRAIIAAGLITILSTTSALAGGQPISSADIRAAAAAQGVEFREGDRVFYGHVELLAKRGVYILETMNTGRLAREGVHEFLFVLGQARIRGTVQMIVNPVAMW